MNKCPRSLMVEQRRVILRIRDRIPVWIFFHSVGLRFVSNVEIFTLLLFNNFAHNRTAEN